MEDGTMEGEAAEGGMIGGGGVNEGEIGVCEMDVNRRHRRLWLCR